MKRENNSEEVKKGAAGNFVGEGSGGVQGSEEGLCPFDTLSPATVRGLPPPSIAKQVPSWSTSRLSSDQSSKIDLARVSSSPIATASRLWSFGSAEISPSASGDISSFKGQLTGMNRWRGDAKKPVETPETVGGKADSADSFGSTLLKKSKGDIKLRANQVLKSQFKENLPTSTLKQPMSHGNEVGSPMDIQRDTDPRKQANAGPGESLALEKKGFLQQKSEPEEPTSQEQVFDMHHIRSTILKQEAVFREQVRELHRVHKVQTLLMAEMRRKDSDLIAHSSTSNIVGPSHSPVAFGMNTAQWNNAMGQTRSTAGHDYEASIALPETLKGGSTYRQRDLAVSRPLQEVNLFRQSSRLPPVRRTFDLERPPDDDDDEEVDRKENDSSKTERNCLKFIESPESCTNEPENEIFSLNLGTGWGKGKAAKEDSEHATMAESEIARGSKRPREETALFPFLATRAESLRDVPLRPTPTVANQSFLGGLWGLQLGRKLDSSSTPEGNRSPGGSEAPKKKERLSLNLEVEEKEVPIASPNGAPHWLLKAPAAKSSKKAVCQTESSSLNFQDYFSPPRNGSDQGMTQSFPQSRGESGSGSTPAMIWDSERHVSDNPPRNRSQSSHNPPEMSDHMEAGARGVYQAEVANVGPIGSERSGYGPSKHAQGMGEAPGEALTLYSSWRGEAGDFPPNSFSHGVFTQSHPLAAGFGVHLSPVEGHPGLAAQGLVQVGPAVHLGTGSSPFVPDSCAGVWYPQTNADSQYQQFQRQQQLASRQPGVVSSSRQGPWQVPMQIPQGGGYGQGPVFAIPAATGPSLGFPVYGMQKVGEDISGPSWTPGTVGPPFTPFSIVVPPKPPFKRPPKLVLTHDGTTMELKLVSPEKEIGAKVVADKSFSGSSDEELSEKKERESADADLSKGRVQDERDVSMQSRGSRERENRASNTGFMKDKGSSASSGGASDWMAKALSSAAHRGSQAVRTGMQNVSATMVPMTQEEAMDDADGGSSDAGSGGSGVGDVINPGDRGSPSMGTFVGGSDRNLPAGEGEEGVNMGELGLQADSESQSSRFVRKEKLSKSQEESAALSLRSSLSMIPRKISRESSDGPGHVVDDAQKNVRRTGSLSEEVEKRASVFHVLEQSGSSSGAIMNLLVNESQPHGLCPQQSLDDLRNAQLELQQPTCSTSQSRSINTSKLQDSGSQVKESSKGAESSASGLGTKSSREQYHERVAMDIDDTERGKTHAVQGNSGFSNFGDVSKQERESKVGHSKQLSGAITSEKGGVQQKPFSPVLRQISIPSSTVDMERHAEGISKKVSQASETDQGNGRSPRRTSEWLGPMYVEQDYRGSPGGIDSSCEEVDGTLTSCNDSSITWSEPDEEVQRTW